MPITANVTNEQITASVGETQIDVSVSGGFGPSGAAGSNGQAATVAVGTVTTGAAGSQASVTNVGTSSAAVFDFTIPAGATGATGPQGATGPAGTTTWAGITDKPSEITNLSSTLSGIDSALSGKAATTDIRYKGEWSAGEYVSGDLVYKSSVAGSEVSGYIGTLWVCTDIATNDEPDGTTAAWTRFEAVAESHAHGAITSDGKVGSTAGLVLKTGTAGAVEALAQGTAGQVLKVNSGATGVEWGAAAADVSIDTTAADILSASSGSITADDPGADRIVFWDDSAGKLTHLTVGTGLAISGTTLSAGDPAVTSPSQITSDQNNYSGFARGINRFSTDAARTMTGAVAGDSGELRILSNIGSFALTLAHDSSSSTAANRFATPTAANYSVPPGSSVAMFYDNTSSRWRVL